MSTDLRPTGGITAPIPAPEEFIDEEPRRRATMSERIAARRTVKVKESVPDRVFLFLVYLLLTVFLLIVLAPLAFILASSFSSPLAISSGQVVFWPIDFTLRGYERVFSDPSIMRAYGNSLFYTIAGTLISVVLTIAIAYPLSRRDLWGRNWVMTFIIVTLLFSGGLIPTYLVVQQLGMLDTRWALLLPQAIAVWQVIIARTYFRSSIPDELYEAAQLDGCSDMRFLWSVVLPLSKPVIAVIALMYAIVQWNSYFDALLYLRSVDLYPLQLVLRNILILNTQGGGNADLGTVLARRQLAELLKYSLIVVSSIPVLVVYPFVARYFTKGILIGAVKG